MEEDEDGTPYTAAIHSVNGGDEMRSVVWRQDCVRLAVGHPVDVAKLPGGRTVPRLPKREHAVPNTHPMPRAIERSHCESRSEHRLNRLCSNTRITRAGAPTTRSHAKARPDRIKAQTGALDAQRYIRVYRDRGRSDMTDTGG